MYELLSLIISVFKEGLETIKFFYKEFDFPLFLLVFIIIFYRSINRVIKNIKSMDINLNEKSLKLETDIENTVINMNQQTTNLIGKYGKEVLHEAHGGGGPSIQTQENDYNDHFTLINSKMIFNQQIRKYSSYEIVEKLFDGYKYLLTKLTNEANFKGLFIEKQLCDLVKSDDLINKFYYLCEDMKNKGGKINLYEVSEYRTLIFATYSSAMKAFDNK